MKKLIGCLFIIVLLLLPGFTKEKKAQFDEKAALSYISEMAGEAMQGRKSGQPGGVRGEEYVAAKFKDWGLEPAGNDGTYFQAFTIEHNHISEGVVLEIITEKERRAFFYGEDWRVQRYSGSGHFTAEIVFVGYGIHAPDQKHDDYAGIDAKDKILLLSSDVPSALALKLGDAAQIESRIKTAQEIGARGVLVFQPSTNRNRYFRLRIDKMLYNPDFVLISVDQRIPDFIFKELKTEIDRSFQRRGGGIPVSIATGVKAFVSVNALFDEKRGTRNILAKITGSDPKLKSETVIIGGHMDHLGIHPLGDVMNGANDNASGTAVTMEIARVMKLNGYRPKRTVVFAAWAAEEQGLLGSEHYASHPTHPLEQTVVYFNMDMVGHGIRNVRFRGTAYGPNIWNTLKEKLPKEILDYTTPGPGGPGGSDHTPFLIKGVPAFALTTDGPHLKYHRSRDDTDLINPAIIKKTGDLVYAAVEVLADEPGDFILPMRQEMFYLKYLNLANFKVAPLDLVITNHGDAKESHVKLQLAVLEGDAELSGDELRFDTIKKYLSASEAVDKARGLSMYTSSRTATSNFGKGKTVVMPGLKGINVIQDDLRWAPVFGKAGLCFVLLEDPHPFFDEQGLSKNGEKLIKALNDGDLFIIIKGFDAEQTKVLLKKTRKPLLVLSKDIPEEDICNLIKTNNSAVGLIWGEEAAAAYIERLEKLKEALGARSVVFVSEACLWSDETKSELFKIFAEIAETEFDRRELTDIFSGNLMRIMDEARGIQSQESYF